MHTDLHGLHSRRLNPRIESAAGPQRLPPGAEDKVIGTNHTLPTHGAANYTGGLWVGK
jgi:histidinol dehydrogenase